MWTFLTIAAGVFVAIGFGGLVWGVTGPAEVRRKQGLRILQTGMAAGGTCLLLKGFSGDTESIIYGAVLLVFGTAVTGIGPKTDKSSKPEA